MDRCRIVHGGLDATAGEMVPESSTVLGADRVDVPVGAGSRSLRGKTERANPCQPLRIPLGDPSASGGPFGQVRQLNTQHGALKPFHSGVVADLDVDMPGRLGVIAQAAGPLCQFVVVGNDRAGIPVCAQILPGIKAKATYPAERAGMVAVQGGSVGLASVFDDRQAV